MTRPLTACALASMVVAAAVAGATIATDLKAPDSLTVGDRLQLTVRIMAPRGSQVTPPVTENGFGEFGVKEWNTDRRELADGDSIAFTYLLATYNPQACSIPSLQFLVARDSAADTLRTQSLPVKLVSLLPAGTPPDSLDIKDLKPQMTAGKPSLWPLWLLLGLAAAGIGGFLLMRWLASRRTPPPPPPPPPPYEEAMAALRRLEVRDLPGQGLIQQFVFELSEILKRYIGRRFDVGAQEFTTDEVVAWMRDAPLARPLKNNAEWFFTTTDPVKFARWLPDDQTVERFLKEVHVFLEDTKPRLETQAQPRPAEPPQEKPDGA